MQSPTTVLALLANEAFVTHEKQLVGCVELQLAHKVAQCTQVELYK